MLKAAIDLAKSAAAKTLEGRRTSKLIVKDADLAEKYYLGMSYGGIHGCWSMKTMLREL